MKKLLTSIAVTLAVTLAIAFTTFATDTMQVIAVENSGTVSASAEESAVDAGTVSASAEKAAVKGRRTVLLYLCGSNLETQAAMASYNIRQILAARFSADEDVRVIIMTGGSGKWQTERDWLVFPDDVNVPEDAVMELDEEAFPYQAEKTSQVSNVYNQIWEARGKDAKVNGGPDPNAGRMVLRDGDGITGAEGTAVEADREFMSDPEVLKAFIDYGVEHYPADKYDLILWDHGGGPTGGFGVDEHDKEFKTMSFSGIVDALAHNKVVDPDGDGVPNGKFDFVDFDACLMSSIELQLVLADYTDYYISSPELEPGYGQYYTNWLNTAGEDPDINTFTLGRQIVDDFMWFYEADEGVGQEGTLTVTDTQKFTGSGILDALADMNEEMKKEAGQQLFYDELSSVDGSIRYGSEDFFDLGNLASLISVRNSEVSREDLEGDGEISDTNAYNEMRLTSRICGILQDAEDKDIIYGRGTDGIISRDQFIRNMDGSCNLSDLHTSGVHIFFPSPDKISYALDYCDEMAKVIEAMPDKQDGRYTFLRDYRQTVIDYALIGLTGRTVNKLINQEKTAKADINYDTVRNYWRQGITDPDDLQYTDWADLASPLLEMRDGGEAGAKDWLDSLVRQQAEEALVVDNVSAKEVRTKTGTGYKIHISDVRNRCIAGVRRNVTAEIPVLEDYLNERFDEEGRKAIGSDAGISLGAVDGTLDYLSELGLESSSSDMIRWMNKKESSWDISPIEEKWYAINDAEGKNHVAAIYDEDETSYTVVGLNGTGEDALPVLLVFRKGDDPDTRMSTLSEVIFITPNAPSRPVKPENLTETVTFRPVIYVKYYVSEYFLPISENAFVITRDNAAGITMSFTDVSSISDIRDTDGDRKVLHSVFTVTDIYDDKIDISEKVNAADEKIVEIGLTRIKTGIYNNGEAVSPEVIYNGQVLQEGKDYTWQLYNDPIGALSPQLKECGEYSLLLKGQGKFTGYAEKTFLIVRAEEAAQDAVDAAQAELTAAVEAVEAAKASGDKDALTAAYERLVSAQNALADAQAELNRTKSAMAKEKQEELEEQISILEDQVKDLTDDLNEAMVIDISNFAVTMAPSIEYDNRGNEIEVSVAGLDPADYGVSYYDNFDIGTATLKITPKSRRYKGEITRTYEIVPRKVDPDVILSKSSYVYNGKVKTPSVTVADEEREYEKGRDYTVSYPSGRKNAGTYKVKVQMKGFYTGTFTRTFRITKAANTLKLKAKTAKVKYRKLKKKSQTLPVTRVIRFTGKGNGKRTYTKVSGSKKITVNKKTGRITVKKGLKKGTYKLKIKVKAAGNKNYKAKTGTIQCKVIVR